MMIYTAGSRQWSFYQRQSPTEKRGPPMLDIELLHDRGIAAIGGGWCVSEHRHTLLLDQNKLIAVLRTSMHLTSQ
jgi:hypothetical protein